MWDFQKINNYKFEILKKYMNLTVNMETFFFLHFASKVKFFWRILRKLRFFLHFTRTINFFLYLVSRMTSLLDLLKEVNYFLSPLFFTKSDRVWSSKSWFTFRCHHFFAWKVIGFETRKVALHLNVTIFFIESDRVWTSKSCFTFKCHHFFAPKVIGFETAKVALHLNVTTFLHQKR